MTDADGFYGHPPMPERRWDDPPLGPPPSLRSIRTTMVFVKGVHSRVIGFQDAEIMHLTFTPADDCVAAMVCKAVNNDYNYDPNGPFTFTIWRASKGDRLHLPWAEPTAHGMRLGKGGFALRPRLPAAATPANKQPAGAAPVTNKPAPVTNKPETLLVACPFFHDTKPTDGNVSGLTPRLEIWDVVPDPQQRLIKKDLPIQGPVAWSPDGRRLAALSARDPSRIVVVALRRSVESSSGKEKETFNPKVERVLLGHTDAVTHLAFLPRWRGAPAATVLVSAARDGYLRVTDVETGRTLHRVDALAPAAAPAVRPRPPRILQVAPDGKLVVTVWGNQIVVFHPDAGWVHSENLEQVRRDEGSPEGWPLCISPDCRLLLCRTEKGFDVGDAQTGRFRGEFTTWTGPPITAAAFDRNGTRIAIGDFTGGLHIFEVCDGLSGRVPQHYERMPGEGSGSGGPGRL